MLHRKIQSLLHLFWSFEKSQVQYQIIAGQKVKSVFLLHDVISGIWDAEKHIPSNVGRTVKQKKIRAAFSLLTNNEVKEKNILIHYKPVDLSILITKRDFHAGNSLWKFSWEKLIYLPR